MNWKKIFGVILLIPGSLFGLAILGSFLYSAIEGLINGYPDSVIILLFFLVLGGCTLSGINLYKSKPKKKTKKRIPARKKVQKKKSPGKKNYFIAIGFIVILSLTLFNLINLYTLKNDGDKFKQVEDRLFEDSLQKIKGVFLINASTLEEVGNEVNYSAVDESQIDELEIKINKMQAERDTLVIEAREGLDMVFSKSIAHSMEKSKGVELNTEMSFNELYSYYISIFDRRYDADLDRLYSYNEHVQTVPELIQNNYVGDCDDYALFLYTLACKKGLQVQYVFGHKDETSLGGHAWIQIKQKGVWMDYDSTYNRICVDCITEDYPYLNAIGGTC